MSVCIYSLRTHAAEVMVAVDNYERREEVEELLRFEGSTLLAFTWYGQAEEEVRIVARLFDACCDDDRFKPGLERLLTNDLRKTLLGVQNDSWEAFESVDADSIAAGLMKFCRIPGIQKGFARIMNDLERGTRAALLGEERRLKRERQRRRNVLAS